MELELRPEDVGERVFYYGKGCDYCNNTGYRGRVGIFEIMVFDEHLRELVMQRAATAILRREAIKGGMRTLRDAGLLSIYDGATSLDEVVRETIIDED
jgi:type IV pilus assembly protein PilB